MRLSSLVLLAACAGSGLLLAGCAGSGLLLAGCAGSIAPYDEAKEPERRAELVATVKARLGDAYDAPVPGLADADLELGREVWYKNCETCHGDHGRGDGPRSDRMQPPPTDLLGPRQFTAAGEYAIIRDGSPGTGMPAFGRGLPEPHLLAVYRYVGWLRANPPPPPED